MAIGDPVDIFGRLKRYLPKRWFGSPSDSTPILDAMLTGTATVLSWVYSLYAYATLQTRIATATDGFLDLISNDFLGSDLPRQSGQSDGSYRAAILQELVHPKATRPAIEAVLASLTGNAPVIVEPRRPLDTGAYGISITGYGANGAYGSLCHPYQAFITVYRSASPIAIAGIAGYGIVTAGYGDPSMGSYVSLASFENGITNQEIYNAIASTKPEGTIPWVRILDVGSSGSLGHSGLLIGGFILNSVNVLTP
jgi:hypothetical protein